MSILKRIFGKPDPGTDKKAEKDIDLVQSGDVHKVYPILKPGNWVGLRAGAVHQTLIGTAEDPRLVIGYGYDAPDNFIFVTHDMGKDNKAILKEAYENLKATHVPFEKSSNLEILTASGNTFSSEKILDQDHMRKAHQMLEAKELWVSIPRRTCMMIMNKEADQDLLGKFLYLHDHAWKDDSYGNAPIINALFHVVDGEIHGIFDLDNQ